MHLALVALECAAAAAVMVHEADSLRKIGDERRRGRGGVRQR